MIVYLAGFKTIENYYPNSIEDIWLLSSFFEHKSGKFGDYVYQEKHILDSGAFSVFKNIEKAKLFDWDTYVKKYIQFIKATKQKLFFELDIDCVVGLNKVEYYRKSIEDTVGITPIPVWHSNRRWEYFEMMCENYPYVAIGGMVSGKDARKYRNNPFILSKFIKTAHSKGAKIHGLGFTDISHLDKLSFDSVDSTTWLAAGRFGRVYFFNNNTNSITCVSAGKSKRVANYKQANLHNFKEWIKYQKYMEML